DVGTEVAPGPHMRIGMWIIGLFWMVGCSNPLCSRGGDCAAPSVDSAVRSDAATDATAGSDASTDATTSSDPCYHEGGFCFYECLGTWRPSDQCAGENCCSSYSFPGGMVRDRCCFQSPRPYHCESLTSAHECVAVGADCSTGFDVWSDWSCASL